MSAPNPTPPAQAMTAECDTKGCEYESFCAEHGCYLRRKSKQVPSAETAREWAVRTIKTWFPKSFYTSLHVEQLEHCCQERDAAARQTREAERAALLRRIEDAEREGFINGAQRVANHRPPSSHTHDGANTLNELRAFCDKEIENYDH